MRIALSVTYEVSDPLSGICTRMYPLNADFSSDRRKVELR
jgi:hypothetical protein